MTKKHFRLILPDEGQDIFMLRKGQEWGYRYGPSIMVHDGICEGWFASPGDCFEADWFTYRRSTDGGKTWSDERVVMTPTPHSMDWFSVCDPAVFKYGDYYYIGYTSTIFADAGGVCNNGFVARSASPTGPFEKWNGNGWGETRETANGTLHWIGKPAPVIYYDEDWHDWGAGEFSFVVKDTTLYIYYTWSSRKADGSLYSETRVATADVTDPNWPGHLTYHGTAAVRNSGSNDSYDVVYCEDLDKFIALATDRRFTKDSFLSVSESDDGLHFTRVNEIRVNTSFMLHNCGISGDCLHHIRKGDVMLLGYAYGNKWGCWGTRLHRYDFEAMDEPFYSETDQPNIQREVVFWERPDPIWDIILTAPVPHYLRLSPGDSLELSMRVMNTCYETREVNEGILYDNFDPAVIEIRDGTVFAKQIGYTYVDAHFEGLFCEFLIYVDDPDMCYDKETRELTSFTPMLTNYRISLSAGEKKQIRGMATWSDGNFFEICEPKDGVTFENLAPELLLVDEDGTVRARGIAGTGQVRVRCGAFAFTVDVTVF